MAAGQEKEMNKRIYIDTETTGLDSKKNEITQLAYIIEINGKVELERDIKLRPKRPELASPKALAVQKKTLADLAAYPAREEGFKTFMGDLTKYVDRFSKYDKFTWVGQNAPFDYGFVKEFMLAMGEQYHYAFFDYHLVDTLAIAAAFQMAGILQVPNLKLESLCGAYNVKLGSDAHDALYDTRATREVLLRMVKTLEPLKQVAASK